MKSELFNFGPITIYGYGLMIAIGVIAAYLTATYRAKKQGLDYEKVLDLAIICFIGGILGAKLLFYISEIKEIIKDPKNLLDISDGFVVYGGIIGGTLAGYLYTRKQKWNFFSYFDLVMPSIALAQGFGRIGCLLAGCCFGKETNSSFGITFHESQYAPNGVCLIPTQIISSALDFLNFIVLIFIAKKVKVKGQVGGFYLIFYSIGRFIVEIFRGDIDKVVGPFTSAQFISIFLLILGCYLVIFRGMTVSKAVETAKEVVATSEIKTSEFHSEDLEEDYHEEEEVEIIDLEESNGVEIVNLDENGIEIDDQNEDDDYRRN